MLDARNLIILSQTHKQSTQNISSKSVYSFETCPPNIIIVVVVVAAVIVIIIIFKGFVKG